MSYQKYKLTKLVVKNVIEIKTILTKKTSHITMAGFRINKIIS